MNPMISRSQLAIENVVRRLYGTESDLLAGINTLECPERSHFLQVCSAIYKDLGNLLFLSGVSEGMTFSSKVWISETEEHSWINYGLLSSSSRDIDVMRIVAQGHEEAILQIEETLEVPGMPENLAMVLKKGLAQIKTIADADPTSLDRIENK